MAIVLLFGVPGSGKSSLAQRLCEESTHSGLVISFDELAKDVAWDEKSFKITRRNGLANINEQAVKLQSLCVDAPEVQPGFIVIDDIMYLRSMRREVYVIARNNNLPLITVWVDTDLEEALRRNSTRDANVRIEVDTVVKIHTELERPDARHISDRHNVVVDGTSNESMASGAIAILNKMQEVWVKSRQERLVRQSMLERSAALAAGNNAQEASLVKDLDLALRNIVANAMKLPAVRGNKPLSQSLGSSFASAKTQTLSDAHRTSSDSASISAEQRDVWLGAHCMECVDRVEREVFRSWEASMGDVGHAARNELQDVFDATRLYIADKFNTS